MQVGNIPKTDQENLPDLLLGDESSLVRLQYQKDENQYLTTKTLKLPSTISHLLHCQTTIFVLTSNLHNLYRNPLDNEGKLQIKVLKLTPDLEIISERIFEEEFDYKLYVGATTYGDHLLISVNGRLLVLNHHLETLGEADLNIGKNADHILVLDNIAYLLDDVVAPLFILKADLSCLEQPTILGTYQFKALNARLTGQWVEPNLNRWHVIEYYSHMGASGTNIRVFPMQGNIQELSCQSIYQSIYLSDRSSVFGQNILAVTSKPPIWSITQDYTNQKLYLTLLKPGNLRSNCLEFDHHFDLTSLVPQDVPFDQNQEHGNWRHLGAIKMTENHLFTLVSSSYRQRGQQESFDDLRLVVFQTKPELRIVLNQKLSFNFPNPKLEISS